MSVSFCIRTPGHFPYLLADFATLNKTELLDSGNFGETKNKSPIFTVEKVQENSREESITRLDFNLAHLKLAWLLDLIDLIAKWRSQTVFPDYFHSSLTSHCICLVAQIQKVQIPPNGSRLLLIGGMLKSVESLCPREREIDTVKFGSSLV